MFLSYKSTWIHSSHVAVRVRVRFSQTQNVRSTRSRHNALNLYTKRAAEHIRKPTSEEEKKKTTHNPTDFI